MHQVMSAEWGTGHGGVWAPAVQGPHHAAEAVQHPRGRRPRLTRGLLVFSLYCLDPASEKHINILTCLIYHVVKIGSALMQLRGRCQLEH